MERQVLSGILPIQNVEPVLYFIAQRMPLELILKLRHPDSDGRTSPSDLPPWTSDELLSSYAESQGFITAKAGRPDLYRAGAFILRQLHASLIPWAFRPPFDGDAAAQDQVGIWIPGFQAKASNVEKERRERMLVGEESESESEREEEEKSESESEEESEEEVANQGAMKAIRSAFAGLEVEEGTDEEEESDEE
ncbi:hypothetical protein P7C70_g3495, partial [Phenoliferia sp. Uapishka_3]